MTRRDVAPYAGVSRAGSGHNHVATSRIGGGNDVISLTNDDIFASGNPVNVATVQFYSDDRTQTGETGTTVGQGNDNVQIANFLLSASTSSNVQLHTQKGRDVVDIRNISVGSLGMSTGTGNDDVSVLNSEMMTGNWYFEEGNDLLKLNGCTFGTITANGGNGIDTLQAHGNTGLLLPISFEIINMG